MPVDTHHEPPQTCTICAKGKMTTRSFKKRHLKRATTRGRHWHSDLTGPFRTPSYRGSRYLAVIIDDRTRYRWILPLKRKRDFPSLFQTLLTRETNSQGFTLETFQTDGGTEFTNEVLRDFLRIHGCKVKLTATGHPQQNPVAERSIRTIKEGVRCALMGADLHPMFWEDAAEYFVQVLNVTANKATLPQGQTPHEAYRRERPNVERFHAFGAPCIFKVDTKTQGALEPPGREGRYLGFAKERSAYKVLDITSRSIYYPTTIKIIPEDQATATPLDLQYKSPDEFTLASEGEDEADVEAAIQRHKSTQNGKGRQDIPWDKLRAQWTPSSPKRHNEAGRRERINQVTTGRKRSRPWDKTIPKWSYACTITKAEHAIMAYANAATADEKKILTLGNPSTLREAFERPDREQWWDAVCYEFRALEQNRTWEIEDLPKGVKPISVKWVLVIKKNSKGEIEKHRARLVARGFTQILGLNYEEFEQYAPVASYATMRMLLAIGNLLDMEIHQLDVDSAYLKSKLDKEIYVKIPEAYIEYLQAEEREDELKDGKGKALRLLKTLYGLKQSGRLWNETFVKALINQGYTRMMSDQSIFVKRVRTGLILIGVYVDDLLVAASNPETMKMAKTELKKMFDMKDQGPVSWLLGMKINRDRENKRLTISQPAYIEKILKLANYEHCNPMATPMTDINPKPSKAKTREVIPFEYRRVVGQLMYLSTASRPDIAAAVSEAATKVNDPAREDYTRVKRILRYLKKTKDYGLVYDARNINPPEDWAEVIEGYADASYGDGPGTRKSRTGYTVEIGGTPIIWSSKRQKSVATSTMEAEYVAAASCTKALVAIRHVFNEMGLTIKKPIRIHEDNAACIAVANNPETSQRTKHIDIKHHMIRGHICERRITMIKCPTQEMKADILTKPLPPETFNRLRGRLNIREIQLRTNETNNEEETNRCHKTGERELRKKN